MPKHFRTVLLELQTSCPRLSMRRARKSGRKHYRGRGSRKHCAVGCTSTAALAILEVRMASRAAASAMATSPPPPPGPPPVGPARRDAPKRDRIFRNKAHIGRNGDLPVLAFVSSGLQSGTGSFVLLSGMPYRATTPVPARLLNTF